MGENSEVISRKNRVTGGGKERAAGGSSNMMGNGRNRGRLRKKCQIFSTRKGAKRRKARKKGRPGMQSTEDERPGYL